jgi:hypothetical protein
VVDANGKTISTLMQSTEWPTTFGGGAPTTFAVVNDPALGPYAINLTANYAGNGGGYGYTYPNSGLVPTYGTMFNLYWSGQNCTGTPYTDTPGNLNGMFINQIWAATSVTTFFLIPPNQAPNSVPIAYQSTGYGGRFGCSTPYYGAAVLYNSYSVSQIPAATFAFPFSIVIR